MFIGLRGSTHALRQEGNLFWRLDLHGSIALLAEGWVRLCCNAINIALLPEGRTPFEMSDLEALTEVRC